MPLNYFTRFVPENAQNYLPGNQRTFLVHNLIQTDVSGNQDWVIENNDEENSIFYARNKYITNVLSKQWLILIDGEKVVFKNLRTKEFLC